jgi:hypothetical protein
MRAWLRIEIYYMYRAHMFLMDKWWVFMQRVVQSFFSNLPCGPVLEQGRMRESGLISDE